MRLVLEAGGEVRYCWMAEQGLGGCEWGAGQLDAAVTPTWLKMSQQVIKRLSQLHLRFPSGAAPPSPSAATVLWGGGRSTGRFSRGTSAPSGSK